MISGFWIVLCGGLLLGTSVMSSGMAAAADLRPGDLRAGLSLGGLAMAFGSTVLLAMRRHRGGVVAAPVIPSAPANDERPPPTGAELCPITALPLRARLDSQLAAFATAGAPFGLLIADVDHFRSLRGTHGFAAADEALREVARRLRRIAPEGSFLARIYGDEFAILVPRADEAEMAALAASMHQGLALPANAERVMRVTVSVGGALAPGHGNGRETLLRAAELALRHVKENGGDGWMLFRPELGHAAQVRSTLRADLRSALRDGQFVPFYQPLVDLRSGAVAGFEVLARWQHPGRGLLTPDEFIALTEEEKLGAELSARLLARVSEDARDWPAAWRFAFNASPGQLGEFSELMQTQRQRGARRSAAAILPPERIELEITENVLITDMALARSVVAAMHQAGARVVLDDFGTGYANFTHLRELPFDSLKIDKSFVQDMLTSPRTDACVRAMLALAHSLDVSVVAEGVETADQARHLRTLGCHVAQGYFYAPPVPAREVHRVCQAIAREPLAA